MIKTQVYQLHDLVPYVDWLYFFHAWNMPPKFSGIAEIHNCPACRHAWIESLPEKDREQAKEAEKLYNDALAMLRKLDGKFSVLGRFGLFPAWSEGEDVVVNVCEGQNTSFVDGGCPDMKTKRLPFLRQQKVLSAQTPHLCLADFVAPKGFYGEKYLYPHFPVNLAAPRGVALGLFATTVDARMEKLYVNDDYMRLLLQTLSDRMAEAAAEKLHEDIRKKYWGYAPGEHFSSKELFAESYEGKRPAVGYPSMPDQSLNFLIDDIINMNSIGIELTSSGMMTPHASVSGIILDHPLARHFSVGLIGRDQLSDYAKRRNLPVTACESFLSRNLS